MRLRGRHYRTGQPIDVVCAAGRITSVEAPSKQPADREAGWVGFLPSNPRPDPVFAAP